MTTYDEGGRLDVDAARRELDASAAVSNRPEAAFSVSRITAAALLDIADSLQTMAVHASARLHAGGYFDFVDEEGDAPGDGPAPDIDLTRADAGTRVETARGVYKRGALTGESGVTEGVPWVGVEWDGLYDPPSVQRVFVTDLAPESGVPERQAEGTMPEAEGNVVDDVEGDVVPKGAAYPEETIESADLVDDIDADFDGDVHTETVDAVAALKARKKAAKKGGK